MADLNPDLSQPALDDIEKEFGPDRAIFVETDVTDIQQFESEYLFQTKETFILYVYLSDAFKETIKTFEHIDILINNAGILNDKTWEKEVAINVVSIVHDCQTYQMINEKLVFCVSYYPTVFFFVVCKIIINYSLNIFQ